MMKHIEKIFLGLALLLVLIAVSIGFSVNWVSSAKADQFTESQKEQIETVIRDYLMENPSLIIDSINEYRNRQQIAEREKQQEALQTKRAELEKSSSPFAGKEDAAVTVVEFFDYNCGYCKRALDGVARLIEENEDVKVVFKEFPILSESSDLAARWALAADKQDRYFDYHAALMEFRGPKNEQTLSSMAESLGLDVQQMKNDANSEEVREEIAQTRALASDLGISGTPAFIIGDQLSPGFVPYETMSEMVRTARREAGN